MKSMKFALLGATFLLSANAAFAADLGGRRGSLKDEPVYAPVISWTGFYLGGHLGGTFSDGVDWNWGTEKVGGGFLGGVQAGYNLQTSGNIVFGIEADLGASGADYTSYIGSVRGRVGIAANRALFYATGGVAFLGWDSDAHNMDDTTGWVAGLGIDYKLTPNLSIGVEGLQYSFSDTAISGDDYDRDFWAVRGRLNYHFGADRSSLK